MKRWLTPKYLILFFSASFLLYFSAFPLGLLVFETLLPKNIQTYLFIFSKKVYWNALSNTLILCTGTTLFTVIVGVPLSWILFKTDIPKKGLLKSLFTIPYIIPPYIGAIAWIKLLNPNSGSVNMLLMNWFSLEKAPFSIYSMGGSIWILGLFFYSFILLSCLAAFEKMDPSLEEAALMCGASRKQTFWDVTLPLLTPALMGGMILVFVAAGASFGVPALVMMPVRLFVLTTKIYTDVIGFSGGIMKAASLSVVLMLLAMVGLWLNSLFLRRRKFTTVTGKYSQGFTYSLGKYKIPVTIGVLLFWGLLVLTPLLTIFISSLLKVYGEPISLSNLSFAKYGYVLFKLPYTLKAFVNSFIFAVSASSISVVLGALIAYLKVKTNIRGRNWIDFMATLPYATPGVIVAIGLIMAFSGSKGINLYNTVWILIAAYTVKYISFAIRNTAAQLEQIDNTLEEAGRTSGAGWLRVFSTILLPILKPTLIASWFLIFMPTFGELTMSILLVGPETETIGTLLFNLQSYDDAQSAAVLATVVVTVILTANFTVKRLTKGKYGV
jgi:iron(III) transport system permease protein